MVRVSTQTSQAVPFLWAAFFLLFTFSARLSSAELEPRWRYPAAGRITAVLGSNREKIIYFLCEDRNLYAVTHNGTPLWKSFLGGKPGEFLTEGPDGTVYTILQNNSLLAVNPRGKIIWETEGLGVPAYVPKVDRRGVIYHFDTEGNVTALSHIGTVKWVRKYGSPPEAAEVAGGRGIFLWLPVKKTIDLVSSWGSTVWEYKINGEPGTLVYIGNVLVAVPDKANDITGIYSSGNMAWVNSEGDAGVFYKDSYRFGSRVFLLDSQGKISILSKGGDFSSAGALPAAVETLTGVEEEGIITGFGEGERFYLQEPTGEVFRYPLTQAGDSVPRRIGSNLYTYGGEGWILYTFRIKGDNEKVFESAFRDEEEEELEPDVRGLGGFQYHYLTHLVASSEVEDKEEALEILTAYLASEDQGNRHYLSHQFLQQLASQGVLDTEYVMGRIQNNFPRIRMQAAGLLARYGDLETRDFLLRVLRYEHDSLAVSAEILALGRMKSDPDGRVGEVIHRIIQSDSLSGGNDRIADAAIRGITYISNYHGTIDENSIDTLFLIFKGPYSKDNRSRALAALQGVGK